MVVLTPAKPKKAVVLTPANSKNMKIISVETAAPTVLNNVPNERSSERFIVFVAGGKRPIISFSNYQRAERLAIFFADLINVRMEVFDSLKEICYFVEPAPLSSALVH